MSESEIKKPSEKINIYDKYSTLVNTYFPEIESPLWVQYYDLRKVFTEFTPDMLQRYLLTDALFMLQKVVKTHENENLYLQSEILKIILEKKMIRNFSNRIKNMATNVFNK